jgi:excisionase family DNA binding protein
MHAQTTEGGGDMSATANPAPLLYGIRETAQVLSISDRLVRRWIASGELPSVRLGGRRLVRHDDLEEFIAARVEPGQSGETSA